MPLKIMDPNDTLSWQHDWTDFLATGESISSRVWTVDPDDSPSLLSNTTSAAVVISGLTAGQVYRLSERITTNATPANVAERALTIRCEEY